MLMTMLIIRDPGSPAGGGRGEEHQPALGVGRICHKHLTGLILRVG